MAQSVQGYPLLSLAEGAGALSPVAVVISGLGSDRNLKTTLAGLSEVAHVSSPQRGTWHHQPLAVYTLRLRQNPLPTAAMSDLVIIQRAARRVLPTNIQIYLGGETAQNANSAAAIAHDTHLVIALVLVIIFLLLLLYLRSLVAALYLIATVLLSFLAALGAGWIVLHDFLGLSRWAGGVTLYAFVFLVALGEDYNIFMLSAIWERRRRHPMLESIGWGVQQSGPVISAAGLILAGTFAVLTALPLSILLEFGSVTAIGVLLDTFVVRSMLVPAITALLKDRAQWPGQSSAQPDQ
jgi:RND superfamily putative drug exporter